MQYIQKSFKVFTVFLFYFREDHSAEDEQYADYPDADDDNERREFQDQSCVHKVDHNRDEETGTCEQENETDEAEKRHRVGTAEQGEDSAYDPESV